MPLATHRHRPTTAKRDVIHKPEVHNVSQRRQRTIETRPQGICTKNRDDRFSSSRDMLADRQTHTERQTHRQTWWSHTPHPYRFGVMMIDYVGNNTRSSDSKIAIQLTADHPRMCVSYARMTLAFTSWPWYLTFTYTFWKCIGVPQMKFLGQRIQKLEPKHNTQTHFLLLWPWPWLDDLDIRTWPRYSADFLHAKNGVFTSKLLC